MIRQSLTAYGRPLVKTTAPLPKPAGSEVLIKTRGCGMCHSDVHLQDGYFDLGEGKQLDKVTVGLACPSWRLTKTTFRPFAISSEA